VVQLSVAPGRESIAAISQLLLAGHYTQNPLFGSIGAVAILNSHRVPFGTPILAPKNPHPVKIFSSLRGQFFSEFWESGP
jgi:hypothetical protein